MLEVSELRKSYGAQVALGGVSLAVEPGRIVGLLGPNGAGKTTLVSIVTGLRRADSGAVRINGIDALSHPQRVRAFIGLAPQDTGVYPVVTARQNLELFGRLSGMSKRRLAERIGELAAALSLDSMLDKKAGELSGGQKRRLHTAIALLGQPPLVLLDESTAGADVETRAALLDVVTGLARDGSAVLYSTHYLHEVETLDASVVILDRGQVVARGSMEELVSSHGSSLVEVSFEGPPPRAVVPGLSVSAEGPVMRIETDDPGRSVPRIVEALGADSARIRSIEIIRPSLESVYLSLTGRRFDSEENEHVVAA